MRWKISTSLTGERNELREPTDICGEYIDEKKLLFPVTLLVLYNAFVGF